MNYTTRDEMQDLEGRLKSALTRIEQNDLELRSFVGATRLVCVNLILLLISSGTVKADELVASLRRTADLTPDANLSELLRDLAEKFADDAPAGSTAQVLQFPAEV